MPTPTDNTANTFMHTTTIAGIPHRKPDLSLLKVGDEVLLSPEPDNKFDPNAIRVFSANAVHLGYIPKMETGLVAGVSTMFIHKIEPQNKWKEVTISTEVPEPEGCEPETTEEVTEEGTEPEIL